MIATPAAGLQAINRRIMRFQNPLKRSQAPRSNDIDRCAATFNNSFLGGLIADRKLTHPKQTDTTVNV